MRPRLPAAGPSDAAASACDSADEIFYYSALISIRTCPESKTFYDRKRAEGKKHVQVVLALARRRVNVLWALLRDDRPYTSQVPAKAA